MAAKKPKLKVKGFLSFERRKVYKTKSKARELDTKTVKQKRREAMLKAERERMELQNRLQRECRKKSATPEKLAGK